MNANAGLPAKPEPANPADVRVTFGTAFVDRETGFYRAFGTITNHAALPISGMIRIIYYDANGRVLTVREEEADDTPFYAPILPGRTGYFFHIRDLRRINGEVDHIDAGLAYAMLEPQSPAPEFSHTAWQRSGDEATFKGTVRNAGNAGATSPSVVVVLLKGGVPIYAASTATLEPDPFPPGAAAQFELTQSYNLPADFDDVAFAFDCGPLSFDRP
jgi:hypothetical protein